MTICLASASWAAPENMKMTTQIPSSITIADKVETRIGPLTFKDGFPTEETAQKIYDQLDFQRAVESVMMTTPGASVHAFAQANRKYGPDNEAALMGWHMLFRLYGPEKAWFDKTWRPGEVELIK